MPLWIKNKGRISVTGLKQLIWNAKRDMIDPEVLAINVFGSENTQIRKQCIWSHCHSTFLIAFPSKPFFYIFVTMLLINLIDCKK